MLRYLYDHVLNDRQRETLKARVNSFRRKLAETYYRYDKEMFKAALSTLGVEKGDTVLVHSSFGYFNGFAGTPNDFILCLLDRIGENGNLLMLSIPYTCSTEEYLDKSPVFDVRKTPSKMGIVSEVFRRKKGVVRSLSPTHPVLVYGIDGEKLVEGHERCVHSCGENSPFERLLERDGKVLFLDAPFNNFTFLHYIENDLRSDLPFDLYNAEPRVSVVIDYDGNRIETKTYTFSEMAVRTRNPFLLERSMKKAGRIRIMKTGNTKMGLLRAGDALQTGREMARAGKYFYSL